MMPLKTEEIAEQYFASLQLGFRELDYLEQIRSGDIFVTEGKVFAASGSCKYHPQQHHRHFRGINPLKKSA